MRWWSAACPLGTDAHQGTSQVLRLHPDRLPPFLGKAVCLQQGANSDLAPCMQLALVYLEACLIGQYVWQVPTRLRCGFATPRLRFALERLGLHADALRCLPLFAAYLATLVHSYSLARQQVRSAERERVPLLTLT